MRVASSTWNIGSSEADVLVDSEHKDDMKRMRTWSHDEKDPEADQNSTKRRRTRSMDAKEEQETAAAQKADMSPAEWRMVMPATVLQIEHTKAEYPQK